MSQPLTMSHPPAPLPDASRFTAYNGAFYMAFGALLYAHPGVAQALFFEEPFVGREASLVRAIGVVLVSVGWLYRVCGRSGSRAAVRATIVDRCVAGALLVPIALGGTLPRMLWTFALLDPALALVAWKLLRR